MGTPSSSANVPLNVLQHEVACAALTGTSYEEIGKRVIDSSHANDDEKAALRLFALSFLSRFDLRRMALERVRDLGSSDEQHASPAGAHEERARDHYTGGHVAESPLSGSGTTERPFEARRVSSAERSADG